MSHYPLPCGLCEDRSAFRNQSNEAYHYLAVQVRAFDEDN
jgi:hypothetical protein